MASRPDFETPDIPWSSALLGLGAQYGAMTAVTDGQAELSYGDLCARAHDLADALSKLGAGPSVCVGTLLPNGLDVVWSAYGVRVCGAAEAPLNWRYTLDEIRWCASIAGFQLVVTTHERAQELRSIGLIPVITSEVPRLAHHQALAAAPASAYSRIMFTSGTTGQPKGAVYTHDRRWIGEQLLKATLPFIPQPGERILLMTPFSHGSSLLTFAWCDHGGEVILLEGVDASSVIARLRQGGISAIFAPPTVLAKLTAAADHPVPGLRCIFTGTQALTPSLYKKASAIFGPIIRVTYGKSECFNPITVLAPADTHTHFTEEAAIAGSCLGWPAPGVDIEIRDDEVWLRARHMSAGMLDAAGFQPHAPDGWHRSGDFGYLDPRGRLILTGRVADVIKTGGYRIHPAEIEACLTGLKDCGDVCVTSVPSEYWGEVIVAIAEQARDGWTEDAARLVAGLSRHKHPRAFLQVDALPRNAQGKVSRRLASQAVLATHELVDGPYPELIPRHEDRAGERT